MARWDKSNCVEYKGINVARRDLLETINYDNACLILDYIKYLYEKDSQSNIYDIVGFMNPFVIFLYEKKQDKLFTSVTEDDIDSLMLYITKERQLSFASLYRIIAYTSRFYDFLIIKNITENNPVNKARKYITKQHWRINKNSKLKTNVISDEQMEIAKRELPEHLRLYMLFSLSTGAKYCDIQEMKWEQVDFEKRTITINDAILYCSKEVLDLLKTEYNRRKEKGLNDCGYVFRSHIEDNYTKNMPISKSTIGIWCAEIGRILGIENLRHLDFRHTVIKKFLSLSGSVGMTSIIMNYPWLSSMARYFIDENNNNDLLQEYKDICEI